MKSHQHINADSGNFEYYTPQPIIEAARYALGAIDLDPASSATANERVKAARFYTEAVDSLRVGWSGRVWMNHPFSRLDNPKWINKITNEAKAGNITGCCITFAATSELWFQPLLIWPQCFLSPRTNYYLPDGTIKRGVTKGSVVTYFGDKIDLFREAFKNLGTIKL